MGPLALLAVACGEASDDDAVDSVSATEETPEGSGAHPNNNDPTDGSAASGGSGGLGPVDGSPAAEGSGGTPGSGGATAPNDTDDGSSSDDAMTGDDDDASNGGSAGDAGDGMPPEPGDTDAEGAVDPSDDAGTASPDASPGDDVIAAGEWVTIGAFEIGDPAVGSIGSWTHGDGLTLMDLIEPLDEPRGESTAAVHLTGDSAVDYYFHAAIALSEFSDALNFAARSDNQGQVLTVALVSPGVDYWATLSTDSAPAIEVELTREWQTIEVAFAEFMPLGGGAGSPPGSAVHFLSAPDAPHDIWLDDVQLHMADPER